MANNARKTQKLFVQGYNLKVHKVIKYKRIHALPLPLLCEISGALHLAQPSLTADRQAGWQADEIQVNFEIFKVGCRSKYSTCRFV